MGVVADAALGAGGEVIGVMPRSLVAREIAHRGLHHLHVVETMHERKTTMSNLADAFLALPGRRDLGRNFRAVDVGPAWDSRQALRFPQPQGLL